MFYAGIELNIGLEGHPGFIWNSTGMDLRPVAKEDNYSVC